MRRMLLVDCFADRPFTGNPAAVCVLDGPAAPGWMQALAAELGFPATVFVHRTDGRWHLRWFSRTDELELCGHGTMAAAHVVWELGLAPADEQISLHSRAGVLRASRRGVDVEIDLPAQPPAPAEVPAALAPALGLDGSELVGVGRNSLDWLIELASPSQVRELRPRFEALARLPGRGFIVTSRSESDGPDFVSRFFAPGVGIDEDQVTGSAHCALGPYWSARLGRTELVGYQASQRGGTVRVRLAGGRVCLSGRVVPVVSGNLATAPEVATG